MSYFVSSLLSIMFILNTILVIPFTEIETAFTKGDAAKIVELGTQKMLISIDGKEGVYSQSQGTQVLDNFFKMNPPKSFVFTFKGKEEETSFAIGDYESTNNKKYRVSMKFKKEKVNHRIESLTIALATP